jgi:hypothetical protein
MVLVAIAWVAWVPAVRGATLKDNFATRETVKAAPLEATGSNVGAGREAGEPVPTALGAAGHSVWLGWEAPGSGYFTFSTCASAIHTVLATYAGSELDKLSEEESEANFGGPECSGIRNGITSLFLTGGKVQVLVDGNGFYVPPALPPTTEGPVSLRIEATPPPPNDDFANAAAIAGKTFEEPDGTRFYFADVFGYNWNASKQTGEPKHAGDQGGASVWYTWTAPESGTARISLCCGTANLLGVYTGGAVNALAPVQSGKGSVEVPVSAGTTYRIAVDSEFSLFLGGTLDDRFDLMVGMNLAPGARPPAGGSDSLSAPDDRAPETTIVRKKVRPRAHSATFAFTASEPGSFGCRLDGRPVTACASPKTYRDLKPGQHTFKVVAIDAAGNQDPTPAVARLGIPKPKHPKAKA